MDGRSKRIAAIFDIVSNCEKLENELLQIDRLTKVEFDLNGFFDDMGQVIVIVRYNIPANTEDYFGVRKEFVKSVIKVAKNNGLTRTEDRVEDHGEHFYFVFRHNRTWKKEQKYINTNIWNEVDECY